MLKKFVSILMLYSALAIMLGHNFIGHHHHNFEHKGTTHSGEEHHHGHHHHNDAHQHDNDTENEDETNDWGQFFAGIPHGPEGLIFLTAGTPMDKLSRKSHTFVTLQVSPSFIFSPDIFEIRQNAPPGPNDCYRTHSILPLGLRAPPIV